MEDSLEDDASLSSSLSMPLPIDRVSFFRHRPWHVVLASFLCHILVYGVCWTVGVWNVVFLEEFGESAARTSVVGALINAFLFVSSFGCSFLLRPLGCRALTLIGKQKLCPNWKVS